MGGLLEGPQIYLFPPIQTFGKDERTSTNEDTSSAEVVQHRSPHTRVPWRGGKVVRVRSEDPLETVLGTLRPEGEEIAFLLEANNVGSLREELLVGPVEEPGGADNRLECSLWVIAGEELDHVS